MKMEQHESLLRHRPRHGTRYGSAGMPTTASSSRDPRPRSRPEVVRPRGRARYGRYEEVQNVERRSHGRILDLMTGRGVDRSKLIRSGLQAGAALAGMAGLTVVGGPGTAAAQEDPTIDPNAPEWEPGVEPRSPRKYRWEPLAADQSALPTGLEVRTIGLGVSVQDRFLNEFERRTGHSSGKVTTLTAMITEWLAGGAQNYDTNETNANRNAALWDTGLLQPIPGR